MGIMDRIREPSTEQGTDESIPISQSTTLAVVNPVQRRIVGLMRGLSNMYSAMLKQTEGRDFLVRQMKIILGAVIEEIEDDPNLFAGETAQKWMLQFAELMKWTVTGDYSKLPPELVSVAAEIEGIQIPDNGQLLPETEQVSTSVALQPGYQTANAE